MFRYAIGGFVFLSFAAQGAVLAVGPDQTYNSPSKAIAAALPGDTIRIQPGTYRDCAVWSKDNLTIEGAGADVILADEICQGAGILVVNASHATIRNVTLQGAESPEGNGSGIRANGFSLTVENCTFRNNQDGILTANNPAASLLVRNSIFERNGACLPNKGCAHGIYASYIGLLRIEHSRFTATRVGHHIKSRAKRTEIVNNIIEDGADGTSSYLIDLPNGGALLMTGNKLNKGPRTQNPNAAVIMGEEGDKRPAGEITITANTFRNDGPPTAFVKNTTKNPARLEGNVLSGPAHQLVGPGTVSR